MNERESFLNYIHRVQTYKQENHHRQVPKELLLEWRREFGLNRGEFNREKNGVKAY